MAKTVNEHTRREAEGLRQLRKGLGLTTTVIAGRLGYQTSQAYELYERGRSRLPLDKVADWAEAFGVPQDEFLRALGLQVVPVQDSALAAMLEAAGVAEEERRQILSSVYGEDLTDDERHEFVALWRQVQARRAERDDNQTEHRRQA